MSIIILRKVNVFSRGTNLRSEKKTYVIPLFYTYKISNSIVNDIPFFRTKQY